MGAMSTTVSNYRKKRGFYQAKDHDPQSNTPLWVVIEPFHGIEDERFFYVKELGKGKYHFEGEGHTFYRPEHLTEHLKELREELEGVIIHYYFVDDNYTIIKKEASKEPVMGTKQTE